MKGSIPLLNGLVSNDQQDPEMTEDNAKREEELMAYGNTAAEVSTPSRCHWSIEVGTKRREKRRMK